MNKSVILFIIAICYAFVLVGLNCYHKSIFQSDDFVYYFKAINETLPRLYNDKGKMYHTYISFIVDCWQGEVIKAYLFNVITLSVMPFIIFMLICIRLKLNLYFATFLSVSYCLSAYYNWEVLPKVSSFLSVFILSSILLFISLKWSVLSRLLLICLLVLLGSYIRPEMSVSLYLLFAGVVFLFFKYTLQKKYELIEVRRIIVLLLVFITSYLSLTKIFGGSALQVDTSSGDKATVISLVQWIGNKYLAAHNQVVINDDDVRKGVELFGQMPTSILHAFELNPHLVISHIFENIINYLQAIYDFIFNLLVATPTSFIFSYKVFILIGLALGVVVYLCLDKYTTKKQLLETFMKYRYVLLLYVTLLLGSIILCIIFYPSRHYLVNQQFFLLLLGILIISNLKFRTTTYQACFQIALPVLMLVSTLVVQGISTFKKYEVNSVRTHEKYEFIADKTKNADKIWALGVDFDVCFVRTGGMAVVIIPEEATKGTIEEYVLKEKFDFIYVDDFLMRRVKKFKDANTFFSSGYKKHFHKHNSPIKNEYLLIPIIKIQ